MSTASTGGTSPSKTEFVRTCLDTNPTAGVRAVNEAWNDAGNEGSISDTLVHRIRSEKGLTGNVRSGRPAGSRSSGGPRPSGTRGKAKGARRGRPPRAASGPGAEPTAAPENAAVPGGTGGLEAEFDRLLFRVMEQGMPDVEDAIRHARRLLVLNEGR